MICLHCEKEFMKKGNQIYCSMQCQHKASDKRHKESGRASECEKQRRDALTDAMVKKTIYIGSKGSVKYNQITPEMITEKRAAILAWRERKANQQPKPMKQARYCKICGAEIARGVYCGDECEKEQRRRESFQRSSTKKILKERLCNECGKLFIPEYGNKRRSFCSDYCLHKNLHRRRKQKERARMRGAKIEIVNTMVVFARDGWRCQICKMKLKRKDRGTLKDSAPELDHIIPLSKGGEHSYRNTQCACRKCNREKAGNERGQLRIFG